ncbi:polysaccharide deacetylase [Nitrospira sp.]|nr:polysaccharide deacetylase [Nitrospira sp.]
MERHASPLIDLDSPPTLSPAPVRFLLTFDDGPHPNTPRVLNRLADNPIQRHIKALFFVQTRSLKGGGSWVGHLLLQREHREGHVLGLHTATTAGHVSHTRLGAIELNRSLADGIDDLAAVTGTQTEFVRPPYWRYNDTTVRCYRTYGLSMLLSEVKAYDGVNWGGHFIQRWNLRSQLRRIPARIATRRVSTIRGHVPIVIAFHDTNGHTAGHLTDYLTLLLEEAALAGLPVGKRPFYDDPTELRDAAYSCTAYPCMRRKDHHGESEA